MELFLDVLSETLVDTAKMLPFLFLAYLFIEYVETRHGERIEALLAGGGLDHLAVSRKYSFRSGSTYLENNRLVARRIRCLFLDRVRVAPNPQINHPSRHLAGFGPFECRRCFQGNWDRSYIGFGCRWPDISSDLDHSVV